MYSYVKRFLDILGGIICICFLIPICMLIKLAYISVGDGKAILYRQKRIGKDGKKFYLYKFRTMVHDAEDRLAELLKDDQYRYEWETYHKFENDPRTTAIGKFLRKTSLDELPQVINVLMGDMSIVGPRPLVEGELESHHGNKKYWNVKPGITGWWACNGRSDIKYKQRLELEYYYVENYSLYLDMLCILKTVIIIFSQRGAK